MAEIFNILTDAPTLVYPNGGEIFTEGDIVVQWKELYGVPTSELIWYEIFITDDFDEDKKLELLQIATVPFGVTSYVYSIQKNLKGTKSRVGIRAANHNGLRSKMSFSANDFIIMNEELPSPSLLEPVAGNSYFSYVQFIFNHESIIGRCSQRSLYQIYYSSDNQGIDWTLLKSNVMVGSDPINIDVSSFNTDSDYVFKIELVDDDNVSPPVFIENVSINNINTFLIDTVPPTGSIKIIDNEEYTRNTSLILQLAASDKTSAIKDVQIQQTNVGNNFVVPGSFAGITPLTTWDLRGESSTIPEDGVKLIQARYRDYGDNVIEDATETHYFRTYKNLDNREVSVFMLDGADLYAAFAGGSDGSLPQLYKNLTLLSLLDEEATAMEIYNGILYVAIKDSENKGILQRFTDSMGTVVNNSSRYLNSAQTLLNSLYSADSVINAMEVFDDTLFLGLENGELLSFRGSIVSSENSDYLNIRSINEIKTDGNLLYIFFDNTTEMLIMDKDAGGNYAFNVVDTGN